MPAYSDRYEDAGIEINLRKLDRFMLILVIVLAIIDISMVVVAITNIIYYDALKTPIRLLSVITLVACFIGYKVNKKYLESSD